MSVTTDTADALRPYAFAIAYRMVGSATEAEDLVQEAMLRLHRAEARGEAIVSPKAYVATLMTRLAIDHLRSARVRREEYVGTWLPEPLLADPGSDAEEHAEMAESLSLAFLVLLESLSPVERAVFLLREVFEYEYPEIAAIVGKSEANCRQLNARARRHVAQRRPRFEASPTRRDELARRFFAASQEGDLDGLLALLAEDAAFYGDGGGKAPAVPAPMLGRERVARLVLGLARFARDHGLRVEPATVNGQSGAAVRDAAGRLVNVVALDLADGRVLAVRSIVNPEKLRHLGPLANPAG